MKFYTNAYQLWDEILVRGYDNGRRFEERIEYKPYLFEPAPYNTPTSFKTLSGKPVTKRTFESIKEARDLLKSMGDVSGYELYGYTHWIYPFLNDAYPGQVDYDSSLVTVLNFDIECKSDHGFPKASDAAEEITAITMSCRGKIYSLGCKPYVRSEDSIIDEYIQCSDEKHLLKEAISRWKSIDPDIVTGWNIEYFDIPYLINRIKNILGEDAAKLLSPWGRIEKNTQDYNNLMSYEIMGISQIDYLPLYKKFSFTNQESYRLDYIAQVVLKKKKLAEHKDLKGLYENDFSKYMDYNVQDVALVNGFEDKLGMIEMVMAMAYDAKINFQDAFTTVRLWDTIIHNFLMDKGIVIPIVPKVGDKEKSILGAYVKEPSTGRHRWVVSFDYKSLYPLMIVACNISPETYLGFLPDVTIKNAFEGSLKDPETREFMKEKNCVLTAGGWCFSKEKQGFLGELMELKIKNRDTNKRLMLASEQKLETLKSQGGTEDEKKSVERDVSRYHNKQLALKIQLNACYGALSNAYFRWFDDKLAEAITMTGQLSILWVERAINEYLNKMIPNESGPKDYVIAMDTDSMYVQFEPLVAQLGVQETNKVIDILDSFCQDRLQDNIEGWIQDLTDYIGAYKNSLEMKREVICDQVIWTAGKCYILNIWDKERVRYEKPKIQIKGLTAIKSSTPSICREALKEAFDIILNGTNDQLIDFIAEFRKKFSEMTFDEVACPRGTTDIEKYSDPVTIYKKGAQPHIRGSLIYNKKLIDLGLDNKYEKIKNGDKVKYAFLRVPNPFRENVIAVHSVLPPEFKVEEYVDNDLQFADAFIKPLKIVTEAVGWQLERVSNLGDLF